MLTGCFGVLQVGYIVTSCLLNENHDFLRLAINTVRNDIVGRNETFQCLALTLVWISDLFFFLFLKADLLFFVCLLQVSTVWYICAGWKYRGEGICRISSSWCSKVTCKSIFCSSHPVSQLFDWRGLSFLFSSSSFCWVRYQAVVGHWWGRKLHYVSYVFSGKILMSWM